MSTTMEASQAGQSGAILIGASSGLKRATPRRFADAEMRLVITARRADKLAELQERSMRRAAHA